MDDLKNVGESSYIPGDGTDQRVQSLVFMMMMMTKKLTLKLPTVRLWGCACKYNTAVIQRYQSILRAIFRSVIPVVYFRTKYTNTCGKGSQKHNYICDIQGVSVYTNVSANYMFRPLLVGPSSGWIP